MRIDLNANEFVLKAADTRHYKQEDKVDGKLILTNQRLYFTTINGLENKMKLEIHPWQIQEVMNFNNRVAFSNGLIIYLKDGSVLKFELKKRNDWIKTIADLI